LLERPLACRSARWAHGEVPVRKIPVRKLTLQKTAVRAVQSRPEQPHQRKV
jgi:hypothetical protein